ncbi:hypothetical protein SKAU_G00289350 [Synaphobranchus kaupii]|uniref:Reverse transcriptase n=1 Tax=Synaphobranchus kaupii TaxID=118154 RepID=A0A9Q1IL61_SYNKA|nr:hypothetical protein SKAU_G00289350 [Synaphobranchus kaupii]
MEQAFRALSTFIKLTSVVLKDLPGVQNYSDDVIVLRKDAAEHDLNLKAVLAKMGGSSIVKNATSTKPVSGSWATQLQLRLLSDKDHVRAKMKAPAQTTATTLGLSGGMEVCAKLCISGGAHIRMSP